MFDYIDTEIREHERRQLGHSPDELGPCEGCGHPDGLRQAIRRTPESRAEVVALCIVCMGGVGPARKLS